jgi:glyoxylase-like metal-dependent hydrolase (beta-lactamase superfamily II)
METAVLVLPVLAVFLSEHLCEAKANHRTLKSSTIVSKPETYEVLALRYAERGQRLRGENFLEAVDNHDTPMPIDFFIWVLRNEHRTVVIDTGFGHGEAAKRDRTVNCLPREALASVGIDAATVEDVVITHLHYDHAGTLGDFPNARFHIQESEMQFATGRWMLDDAESHAYSADHVCDLVHSLFEKRVRFHSEDGEVAPGVSVHRMAGHTMGIQSVRVPTERGNLLLASDASHYYEHWVKGVPFAICWSQPDLMASYDKFEQLADSEDHVIPGHDPLVRDLYPAYSSATGTEVVRLDAMPLRTLKDVFPER